MPKKMVQVSYFSVTGKGEFPLEMLPYDNAWPVSYEDLAKAMPRYGQDEDRERFKMRTINMACAKWAPTVGRWESFGWRVIEGN